MPMICYKLVRKLKDGSLSPLFINKKLRLPLNTWLDSEFHPTKGFAERKGWHCTLKPIAPHLKDVLTSGEERVWVKCEVQDYEYFERPKSQGGMWLLAQKMLIVEDYPDSDIELEVSMEVSAGYYNQRCVSTWLNKEQAKLLVDHLKQVFEI